MPSEPSFPLPPGSTYSPEDDVLDAIPGNDMAYEDTPEGDMVGRGESGTVTGVIVQGARKRVLRDGGLYTTLPGLGRVRIVGAERLVGVKPKKAATIRPSRSSVAAKS